MINSINSCHIDVTKNNIIGHMMGELNYCTRLCCYGVLHSYSNVVTAINDSIMTVYSFTALYFD